MTPPPMIVSRLPRCCAKAHAPLAYLDHAQSGPPGQTDCRLASSAHGRRPAADGRRHSQRGVLPAELVEPVVADPEMVRHLMHDGPADLVDGLVLGAADRANRPAVNG